jgi:predicted negative regulator of RcsB-dependent stress response
VKDINQISLIDKANRTIDQNKTAFAGLLILLLVGFASYTAYTAYSQRFEDKAQSAFFEAERLYAASQPPKETAKDAKNVKPTTPAPVDTTQVEEKLNSVITDYPKSNAGMQASILIADIHLQKNDSAKAIQTLERSFSNFSGRLIDSLMALKLSGLYEQNKQCDKALPVLDKVYNSKVLELKPEALLREALCEETLGQKDKAKQSYQKLATEYSDSSQGQQAQKFLKIMDNNS